MSIKDWKVYIDLPFEVVSQEHDGFIDRKVIKCPNGFGASVVRGIGTYGAEQGLWELAVLKFDDDNYGLTYDTPITNDVIGYLSEQEVLDHLIEISKLEKSDER